MLTEDVYPSFVCLDAIHSLPIALPLCLPQIPPSCRREAVDDCRVACRGPNWAPSQPTLSRTRPPPSPHLTPPLPIFRESGSSPDQIPTERVLCYNHSPPNHVGGTATRTTIKLMKQTLPVLLLPS